MSADGSEARSTAALPPRPHVVITASASRYSLQHRPQQGSPMPTQRTLAAVLYHPPRPRNRDSAPNGTQRTPKTAIRLRMAVHASHRAGRVGHPTMWTCGCSTCGHASDQGSHRNGRSVWQAVDVLLSMTAPAEQVQRPGPPEQRGGFLRVHHQCHGRRHGPRLRRRAQLVRAVLRPPC